MKPRRMGCMFFGIVWLLIFGMTNFVLALGDPVRVDCTGIRDCDPHPARWMDHAFWVELGVLIVGMTIFYRAEMRGED